MAPRFYLTTPLYYVNDEPHLGHAYTTILADVLARYKRLFYGTDSVHLLTGLDEHGQKVSRAAAKAGLEPQQHCDRMASLWIDVWEKLGISCDDFIRTTEQRHVDVVTEILNRLYQQGDIYQKEYEGWYSVYEERFFTEKDLDHGKDPIGGRPVEKIKETNYFFRMSNYQNWLIQHYEKHPDAVLPSFRMNEVKGFLRQPLEDLCISRPKSRLTWGIPIPWDEDYVTYVWFDALINYYTATKFPPEAVEVAWPADIHLIGKDILTTHAVFWPIMLHAAGIDPPRHILAHGWWMARDDAKMSKSTGEVVKPLELADKYGPDAFRFFLMREMVLGQDAGFSEEALVNRINADLANDLGNLYSRLAKLWHQFEWGTVPRHGTYYDYVGKQLPEEFGYMASSLEDLVRKDIDAMRPHSAIEKIFQAVRALNRSIEICEPWKEERGKSASIANSMMDAFDVLYKVAELLEPVMPVKMAELKSWIYQDSPAGRVMSPQPGRHLFPRIKLEKRPQGAKLQDETIEITIDEFNRLDIRVGVVTAARPVKGTDKLLSLEVDLGSERRQIVAGIAETYSHDQMIGRRIVVLTNLKPVKLRGELSRGMLLAAGSEPELALLTTDREVPPGSKVI